MSEIVAPAVQEDPVVSPEWLSAHLEDPDVAVLDASLPLVGVVPVVDTRAAYVAEHIPGAVFFDVEAFSDQETPLPHMLPEAETFGRRMGALGLTEAMTFVVYEGAGVFSAPRAWWMLRTMGARRVYVLQGGLRAWKAAGYAVEAGEVQRVPAIFRAQLDQAAVRRFADMRATLQRREGDPQREQIVDARPAPRFTGDAPEPRPGIRSGHMPGAVSVPASRLVENGELMSPAAAGAAFAAAGVDLSRPVVTTCGSGITAAIVSLQLQRAGAREVTLYDGSWAEYAQEPEAEIAVGD